MDPHYHKVRPIRRRSWKNLQPSFIQKVEAGIVSFFIPRARREPLQSISLLPQQTSGCKINIYPLPHFITLCRCSVHGHSSYRHSYHVIHYRFADNEAFLCGRYSQCFDEGAALEKNNSGRLRWSLGTIGVPTRLPWNSEMCSSWFVQVSSTKHLTSQWLFETPSGHGESKYSNPWAAISFETFKDVDLWVPRIFKLSKLHLTWLSCYSCTIFNLWLSFNTFVVWLSCHREIIFILDCNNLHSSFEILHLYHLHSLVKLISDLSSHSCTVSIFWLGELTCVLSVSSYCCSLQCT